MNAASYYHGDCRPKKPDMTIDVRSSLKVGVVVLSRPRTVRESPRHSLADRYLGPARQTVRSPSVVPE